MRWFVLLTLLAATLLHAQETYVLGRDSMPQAGVAKGSVTKYELKAGRFYPGTPHTYSVYLPAQYLSRWQRLFIRQGAGAGGL